MKREKREKKRKRRRREEEESKAKRYGTWDFCMELHGLLML